MSLFVVVAEWAVSEWLPTGVDASKTHINLSPEAERLHAQEHKTKLSNKFLNIKILNESIRRGSICKMVFTEIPIKGKLRRTLGEITEGFSLVIFGESGKTENFEHRA